MSTSDGSTVPTHGNILTRFASKFIRKAFSVNTFDTVYDVSGGEMKRSLKWFHLMLLGVGTMVGAGIFVSTGSVAQDTAGPAINLSYLVAGGACVLSALAYAEYACDYPIAGGAFNFITLTFGEFVGWLIACNLFIEWTLANAAVAKGFTGYFANLIGVSITIFQPYSSVSSPSSVDQTIYNTTAYTVGYLQQAHDPRNGGRMLLSSSMSGFGITIDWLAPIFIFVLCLILMLGTSESTIVQNVSMAIYLILILFIIIAGGTQVHRDNYSPYFPYGVSGVFFGASNVFFSFVGFDMVASLAEEAVNPSVDLPIGIVGSIGFAASIYVAMSTVLLGMSSYLMLDPTAPFSSAFQAVGWQWAAKIVAVGAVLGCTNSNYGGLLGQSRIFTTMSRAGLLPKIFAKMSARQVPIWSIALSGGLAALIAFFIDLSELWDLVSMGTLVSFGAVCLGTIWRRYYGAEDSSRAPPLHQGILALLLALIIGCGFACGFSVQYSPDSVAGWAVPLGCFFPIAATFHFFPQLYIPNKGFTIPVMPWLPACGMMVNGFLIGLLGRNSNIFWGSFMGICVLVYLAYGLHNTQGEGDERRAAAKEAYGDLPVAIAFTDEDGGELVDLKEISMVRKRSATLSKKDIEENG